MNLQAVQARYSESIQRSYFTSIGECVTIKNLQRGPFGRSLEPLMTSFRNEDTGTREFRYLAKQIYNMYVIPEFLQTLSTQERTVITGNKCKYDGAAFVPREIVLIDIPTAGTAPTELIFDTLNYLIGDYGFDIHKGFTDIERIEAGGLLRHDKKRVRIRSMGHDTYGVFADIMNASAGTYESAVKEALKTSHFKENGNISKIFIAPLISSVEGVCRLAVLLNGLKIQSQIVSASIDPEIDGRKYIKPGCGDAGDRMNNR